VEFTGRVWRQVKLPSILCNPGTGNMYLVDLFRYYLVNLRKRKRYPRVKCDVQFEGLTQCGAGKKTARRHMSNAFSLSSKGSGCLIFAPNYLTNCVTYYSAKTIHQDSLEDFKKSVRHKTARRSPTRAALCQPL